MWRADAVFHLHRFQHHQGGAGVDGLADLDQYAHDGNVSVLTELESATAANSVNSTPNTAEFLGNLAPALNAGDDARRLGFELHGFLQTVAAVLKADVRECDVVARLGGDEFAVLMTDLDRGSCAARAQALSDRLNGHAVDWHGTVLPISASVGFVDYSAGDTPAGVPERADKLMYLQKNARRGTDGRTN